MTLANGSSVVHHSHSVPAQLGAELAVAGLHIDAQLGDAMGKVALAATWALATSVQPVIAQFSLDAAFGVAVSCASEK